MYRTNIYLDTEQMRALKHLAAEQGCSVAELVRRAVDAYIVANLADQSIWRERLDEFVARVQSRMPKEVPAQRVEEDISLAREEVRQGHGAASRH